MKPIIAITMGDGAGVGPEIIMKALVHPDVYEQCRPLVIGDAGRFAAAGSAPPALPSTVSRGRIERPHTSPGVVDCVDLKLIPPDLPWGQLSAHAGEAAYQCLAVAAKLASKAESPAICTAPLNKEALHAAGTNFPGTPNCWRT